VQIVWTINKPSLIEWLLLAVSRRWPAKLLRGCL
jgi:hypothetical protein